MDPHLSGRKDMPKNEEEWKKKLEAEGAKVALK